jgi:starvation-inducible outer membrane lipoprotein
MRKGILALAASLVLSACASLQIPVNLDPGEYREGTYRLPL